ncbi:side tail fiber protein [Tianweitania populi]|uniref:Side tail fiber protein n=2 Tax=Tianweitania populi TaxID=1607949 RepID=A0A8J3DW59_9HYPH|nr:side tail fiber protein [Tianweitania populi]
MTMQAETFKLSGTARPKNALSMLDEICEHFVEHSDVERSENFARLSSPIGNADIVLREDRLLIELTCPTKDTLHLTRNSIAEHLFYFAGDDPLELTWTDPAPPAVLPNLTEVTVVSAEDVTPHMRRVKFRCEDVSRFIGAGMHVRMLVPPRGREPVWPGLRDDGRLAYPTGDDELLVRVYTIRAVDAERRELWVDFLQHPIPGVATPGADFARDAQPGDKAAFLGPGGGSLPEADTILMVGDEAALPAIARIAAEVPAGTRMKAIIEVEEAAEEQPLPTAGILETQWLHRKTYPADAKNVLRNAANEAIKATDDSTFVWVACEKEDVRTLRSLMTKRRHNKKLMYIAWYWARERA